jgi:hypothetical protein
MQGNDLYYPADADRVHKHSTWCSWFNPHSSRNQDLLQISLKYCQSSEVHSDSLFYPQNVLQPSDNCEHRLAPTALYICISSLCL